MQAGHHEVEAEEDELVRDVIARVRVIRARQQPSWNLWLYSKYLTHKEYRRAQQRDHQVDAAAPSASLLRPNGPPSPS